LAEFFGRGKSGRDIAARIPEAQFTITRQNGIGGKKCGNVRKSAAKNKNDPAWRNHKQKEPIILEVQFKASDKAPKTGPAP
jgi:hypothetical protein